MEQIIERQAGAAAEMTESVQDAEPSILLVDPGMYSDPIETATIRQTAKLLLQSGAVTALHRRSTTSGRFSFLRRAAHLIPRFRTIHILFRGYCSTALDVLPLILMSRFYGREIVFHYRCRDAETRLDELSRLERRALRLCDRVVCGDERIRDLLMGMGLRAGLMYDPLDSSHLPCRVLRSVQPHILVVGPLEQRANVPSALKAFTAVKQKYPRAEMTILGDGSERGILEAQAHKLRTNGVRFVTTSSYKKFAETLGEVDVFVSASVEDVLPGSMLRAMAAGVPVVVTDVGGIARHIEDGRSGLLVPINDHNSLAMRIIELIEHPELVRTLSQRGRWTIRKFEWARVRHSWLGNGKQP